MYKSVRYSYAIVEGTLAWVPLGSLNAMNFKIPRATPATSASSVIKVN